MLTQEKLEKTNMYLDSIIASLEKEMWLELQESLNKTFKGTFSALNYVKSIGQRAERIRILYEAKSAINTEILMLMGVKK